MTVRKSHLVFGLVMAVMLTSSAQASTTVSAFTLGTLDSVISFCRQVNPAGGAKYLQLRKSLTGGLSDHALVMLQQSPEYGIAYSQFGATLRDGLPDGYALNACREIIPGGSDHGNHGDHDGQGDRDGHDGRDGHGERDR